MAGFQLIISTPQASGHSVLIPTGNILGTFFAPSVQSSTFSKYWSAAGVLLLGRIPPLLLWHV